MVTATAEETTFQTFLDHTHVQCVTLSPVDQKIAVMAIINRNERQTLGPCVMQGA